MQEQGFFLNYRAPFILPPGTFNPIIFGQMIANAGCIVLIVLLAVIISGNFIDKIT